MSTPDAFDQLWALLSQEERFLTREELTASLGDEALWDAAAVDPRFASSVVRQGKRGEASRYQTLGRAAERVAHLLSRNPDGLSRQEICGKLCLRVGSDLWENLVKRLRFRHHVEAVDRPRRAPLYRVLAPEERPDDPPVEPSFGEARLEPGEVVLGRYILRKVLAEGRYGTVYGAHRQRDGARVIVKAASMLSEDGGWADDSETFRESSRLLRSIRSSNVVRVLDYHDDAESGVQLRVEEALLGGTLETRVLDEGRRLAPDTFRALTTQLLEVLAALHSLVPPVIHRSVQPQHIRFRAPESWQPVLVDFAAAVDPARLAESRYSAPEVYDDAPLVPSSDLYSLGLTLLFVVTHREPDELERDRKGRIQDLDALLAAVEPALRDVLMRLVEPRPRDRFQSASEAVGALRAAPTAGGGTALTRTKDAGEGSLVARVKREGWLAQTDPEARPWWIAGYVASLIFFMPLTILATIAYVLWRRS